jgi:ABC-type Fe3+/spermidine/putrescine transport system ATPase subunit
MGSRFEFRSVSKSYGSHSALSEVSFTLNPGAHTALLGASGCGKSTVLRLLAGLDGPSSGQVCVNGQVASEQDRVVLAPHLRGVAMVFQDLALWPNLSVLGNVLLGLAVTGISRRDARRRAHEALALCHLDALAQRKPGQISGGQQQRVALARAVAVRPTFLVLDEPFASLDLVTKSHLLREIALLRDTQNLTILVVTHDPAEATTLCQFAMVLDQGRLVESGPWKEILIAPQSDVLKAFGQQLRMLQSLPGLSTTFQ